MGKNYKEFLKAGNVLVVLGGVLVIGGVSFPFIEPSLDSASEPSSLSLLIGFAICVGVLGVLIGAWWHARTIKKFVDKNKLGKASSFHRSLSSLTPLGLLMIIIIATTIGFIPEPFRIPSALILIGLTFLFNKFFSPLFNKNKIVPYNPYSGWFFVVGGLLNLYLIQFDIKHLDAYFIAWLGLGVVMVGLNLIRRVKPSSKSIR